jgi:hypothetical protein
MLEPSGEKDTEVTQLLCALCFSALSSREAVASMGALSFGLGQEYGGLRYTCIPGFDRAVLKPRHNQSLATLVLPDRDTTDVARARKLLEQLLGLDLQHARARRPCFLSSLQPNGVVEMRFPILPLFGG